MPRLDEIKQRMNAATLEPWVYIEEWGSIHAVADDDFTEVVICPDHDDRPDDMTFIANAREDVPWLVARVEELTAAVETMLAWSIKYWGRECGCDDPEIMTTPWAKCQQCMLREAIAKVKGEPDGQDIVLPWTTDRHAIEH
jgi:hypothetical protein